MIRRSSDRRSFLIGSVAGTLALACGSRKEPPAGTAPGSASAPVAQPAKKTILILGGTNFIGPHIVDAARARGHTLTLFNRGKTHPNLFPDIEKLQGDRDGKLEALRGRTWDAVVDTSGFVPRIVKMSAELLAQSVQQYVFISTISVYAKNDVVGADESAVLNTIDDPTNEEVRKNYGALKALSERAAEAAMPGRVANIRPGLIVGPLDPTGRFTHWPSRCAEGGEVLAPGDGSTPTQYVDARDLAAWIVKVVENRAVGTYNALGPGKRLTMKEMLDACNQAGGNKASLTWVDAAFLDKEGVEPWSELPVWFDNKGEMAGFGTMSNARAVQAGLTFRPTLDTAKDTLAWLATLPEDERVKLKSTAIKRDKEEKVLAAWKALRKP